MNEEKSVVDPELTEIEENPENSETIDAPVPAMDEPTGMMNGIPVDDNSPLIRFRRSVWDSF